MILTSETTMHEPTDRIVNLREQTLRCPMMAELPPHTWSPRRDLLLGERWIASGNQPTTRLRRAAAQAYRLDRERPAINDYELIVGCPDV